MGGKKKYIKMFGSFTQPFNSRNSRPGNQNKAIKLG